MPEVHNQYHSVAGSIMPDFMFNRIINNNKLAFYPSTKETNFMYSVQFLSIYI